MSQGAFISETLDSLFETVKLTGASRPQFQEDEIEVFLQSNVTVKSVAHRDAPHVNDAKARLTTHRLMIECESEKPRAISLSKLQFTEQKTGGLFSKPRITAMIHGTQDGIKIVFRSGGNSALKQFSETLQKQLQRRNWEKSSKPKTLTTNTDRQQVKKPEFCVTTAGIGGIMRRIDAESQTTKKNLNQAFTDLTSLMDNAREMVVLAEKFASKMKQRQEAQVSAEDKQEQEQFNNLLLNMGMTLPGGSTVSKHTAGAQYHQELAREIADFLDRPLKTQWNGVIALTDAFCLYNRARGTDLISPEDMQKACELFKILDLKIQLKTFDSGVTVIQSEQFTDEAICQRIEELLQKIAKDFVTVVDIANSFGVSIVLAREQLLIAEQRELLCRDEATSGINFYPNIFLIY